MAGPRRILITGAAGFVGRHLVAELGRACPDAALMIEPFDVTDAEATRAAVRAFGPDGCVHLAGVTALPAARLDPERAWRVNLGGTLNLARAVLSETPACRFLYVSSAEAYGLSFRAGVAVDETAALAPMNTYAATKAAADLAVGAMAAEGLWAIRLRPFNHTGPGQSDDFVVAAFAQQLARIAAGAQPARLRVGALDTERDFLDVRDVCAAYAACLLAPAETLPAGAILNLASGRKRRIGEVLRQMCDLSGLAPQIETDADRLRPSEIPTAVGDARLAQAVLGWRPVVAWEDTLRDVLADWLIRVG